MKRKIKLISLFVVLSQFALFGQQKGKVIIDTIDAPSMSGSVIGEPVVQPVAVYLPPSYYIETQKRYPVVYFLPGYEDTIAAYTKGYINGYYFESSMNSNITQGKLKEVIMVIVNGFNILEGSFFNNSLVTGNWEDFVVNDVVGYMDNNYRTIPSAGSRALMGLSMGGYGAMHLTMRHPSVFSIGVGECAGLANPYGMMKTTLFSNVNIINRIISIRNKLNGYSKTEAHQKYLDTIKYYRKMGDWETMFSFAYGSAFAVDTALKAPYFDYPFSKDSANNLVKDTVIFKQYESGFGNLKNKVTMFKDSLLKLKGYAMDYGTSDYFQWIIEGNIYYDSLLNAEEIPHRLWKNSGGHGDLHKSRTENVELPYCDSLLTFDTLNLSNLSYIDKFTCYGQSEVPVIDTFNKKVSIIFKAGTKLSAVKPVIYISPGAKISPAQGTAIDLTSGLSEYTVTSESKKNSLVWTVNATVSTGIETLNRQNEKLLVSPNPATDYFVIAVGNNTINKFEVSDLSGRLVNSNVIKGIKISVTRNNIPSGVYVVRAYTDKGCAIGKVLLK